MRIAYATGEYPRATDTFIQREVAALRDLGVEVHTFSARRTGQDHIVGAEQVAEQQATHYLLPIAPLRLLASHLRGIVSSPRRYLAAAKLAWQTRQPGSRGHLYQLFYFLEAGLLAEELRARDIEHLHNHFANSSCTTSMLAAELAGISFSFTMHGPAIFFEPERWRLDEKIRRALFVACISHYCRSQGMIHVPATCWDRLHIVHCGVDPSLFEPVSHAAGHARLLFVGRLANVKGLPVLLESLASLSPRPPELRLTIVGDGPDRSDLEAQTHALGLDDVVSFTGYRSQTEVREELSRTDVFVLPSFAEGVPVVLMEALAAGVPVVTTRIAGVGELVEDGVSGFLVPPGDVRQLGDRIQTLLAAPELRTQFGAAGRTKVTAEFDIRREASWLHEILTARLAGESVPIRRDPAA